MRTLRAIAITVVSTLFVVGSAAAADLYTPPLAFSGTDRVSCDISNVSAQTRSLTLQLIDLSGTVRLTGESILSPGESFGAGTTGLANDLFRCHFAVDGTKGQFRAAIKRRDLNGGDIVVVPAD